MNPQRTRTVLEDIVAGLPPIATSKELGIFLKVHQKTVNGWAADGRFPGAFRTTPGPKGRWRFPRSAVSAFLSGETAR